MKKIKITLPENIIKIIYSDAKYFDVSVNFLLNFIFDNFKDIEIRIDKLNNQSNLSKSKEKKSTLQFTLNKKNFEVYYFWLAEKNIQVESKFMRDLILTYTNKTKRDREFIFYKDTIARINHAIKEKKSVKMVFFDKREVTTTPYYVGSSELSIANYLFCFDESVFEFKNYRINHIKFVYISEKNGVWENEKFIKDVIDNFDPFLSNDKYVTVRLSKKGEEMFNNLHLNRPEIFSNENNLFILEASEEKAKRYFSYFLDEVEILAPLSLRKWFVVKFKNALKNYE